jgi:hypothetical protein
MLAAVFLLCEILLFHSGFYARILDPDLSATGYLERIFSSEARRPPTGKKEILVAGNSRIGEGFSAKIANNYQPLTAGPCSRSQGVADCGRSPRAGAAAGGEPEAGYWFLNFGVNATGVRVWYYLVRDVDPHRDRYAAIAIPIDDYDDPDDYEDVAERASEMPLLANRLKLTDLIPYTLSFHTWAPRREVLRDALLLGATYQRDFQLFVEHPIRRLRKVADLRAHGAQMRYDYLGMNHSLAGLQVDWTNQRVTFPPSMTEQERRDYSSRFFSRPPQLARNRAFEVRWLGALVDLYRNSKTRIILFQPPRSPAPRPTPLAHLQWTIIDELRKRPWVRVIDRHTFEDLERPELFADHVHLNSTGRQLFSPRFAQAIEASLH